MKDLAVAIFDNQDGAPVVDYPPLQDTEKWQHTFFSQADDRMNLLREACPIIRIGRGNQYRFIHQSLLEYGLARAVFEPRAGREQGEGGGYEDGVEGSVMLGGQQREDREATQEAVCSKLDSDINSPLYRKSFVNKPSVLQFLAERVQQEPIFEKKLRASIEQSKADKTWSVAAANAMTILVRAGIRFNGADLTDISVPGADLSGGEFDGAQLQGADLSGTTLRNIWLRQADLSNARMEEGHTGFVTSVVFSISGQQIASGSEDNSVRLWDAQSGAPGHILSGHTNVVMSVVYSPSGKLIASGSWDETVRLWGAQSGAPSHILSGHTSIVTSIVFSPSGQQIASGSEDNSVRLWDAQSGAPGHILSGHTYLVRSVVYSPSGQQIASGSYDNTVRLWDAHSGAPGHILSGHTNAVMNVMYSPSGQQIASGSRDNTVRL
ncbi:hypothetical protein EDD11_008860 [Mortierella claussenii]|nr:hypothetical protein EDD11_008860 [Mortierella claussenii]